MLKISTEMDILKKRSIFEHQLYHGTIISTIYTDKLFLTLPAPCISGSYINIKINSKFLFSHFFVVPLRPS